VAREPDPTGFDDIVAALQREGGIPQWPADNLWPGDGRAPLDENIAADDQLPGVVPMDPFDHPGSAAEAASADNILDDVTPEDDADPPAPAGERAADPLVDDHFVPPEPPPLPRLGPPILVGLTLIALGLVLVTFPGWVGVPQVYGLPLGLVAIASGLGWLVLRLWPDTSDGSPPIYLDDPDDPDGGAVL
jgi:hypothetical protein